MPLRRRDNEPTTKTPEREEKPKDGIDNKLELLKYTSEVQSRLRKDITSDFVLCKLGEQDKIGVTEMTINAYLAARQIQNIICNAKKYTFSTREQTYTY